MFTKLFPESKKLSCARFSQKVGKWGLKFPFFTKPFPESIKTKLSEVSPKVEKWGL
jgi:hypothetical protein